MCILSSKNSNYYYWIKNLKERDLKLLDNEKIKILNNVITKKTTGIYDLENHKIFLYKNELIGLIEKYTIPQQYTYNKEGKLLGDDFFKDIIRNTNKDAIKEICYIKYGISIKDTFIRSFPTENEVFYSKQDTEFDRLQETSCQAFEPLIVLHESRDEKWYFIKMYNYTGWVKKDDIALCEDKREIFNYVNNDKFIIVTGKYAKTQPNPSDKRISNLDFSMGTKIFLNEDKMVNEVDNQSVIYNYQIKIPVKDKRGKLDFKIGLIAKNEDVSVGYLPYSTKNILKQAFKLIGHRYGWGDNYGGRDCSSFVMYVFKTFGIRLPRNTNEQEKNIGVFYEFNLNMTIKDRLNIFDRVSPGALVYMPGHVMIYIGKDNKVPYIIHALNGYGGGKGNVYKFTPVNEIVVTPVTIRTFEGIPFIEKFTSVVEIR
ncbi:MAG: SH3 domain-containing protein [Thermoanaerobacteraceae bacterium]